ncbi:MAG: high-affinity branched-chain amino acid ABC transporter permease LivM [Proteobacteria bacterium]|nr:high-affinity branched-chain amino acid ABC transporter permease LivM [Pseudomonadota bacterium]
MVAAPKDTSFSQEANKLDTPALIKDLIGTAVITFLILTPIVAYETIMNQGTLLIESRWGWVFLFTAITVVGRLLLHLFVWQRAPSPKTASAAPSKGESAAGASFRKNFNTILFVFALLLPFILYFIPGWDKRGIDFAITILIYIMLAWGLNIVVGLAGLLDLGYVAFYAVGAYAYALLTTVYLPHWFGEGVVPWAFYIVLPIAGALAALWGVILGFPVLRLRGDYLAIVTLAFGEIIRLVLINWFWFTNGPQGINVPKITFFGLPFNASDEGFAAFFGIAHDRIYSYFYLYYVILALALLTFIATNRLRRLPIGRAWEALREDEIACRSLGINTTNTKLTAFAIGAMFGGFAGSFFAARQGFVSPESFVFIESALILAIVVLGGLGSQIGIVFAAIAIIGAFEVFREMGFLSYILPEGVEPVQFRMLAVGLAMVLMMRWRPRGFVTRRDPTVFLKEKKSVSADLVSQGHG